MTSAPPPPPPGSPPAGGAVDARRGFSSADYQIVRPLGDGVAHETFLAKTFGAEGFEKLVVVKRLRERFSGAPGFVERWLEALRDAARLSHANVVRILDVGEEPTEAGRTVVVVEEHVAGLDLAALVARAAHAGLTLPAQVVCFIGSELTKGLDHAHRHRSGRVVAHGGLTPREVLVSWEGEVKAEGFAVAPELVREDPAIAVRFARRSETGAASPRDDLFALGVVLGRALTGATAERVVPSELAARCRDTAGAPPELGALVDALLFSEAPITARSVHEELLALGYRMPERPHARGLAELALRLGRPGRPEAPAASPIPPSALDAIGDSPATESSTTPGVRREVSLVSFVGPIAEDLPRRAVDAGGRVAGRAPDELRVVVGIDGATGRDVEQAVTLAGALLDGAFDLGAVVHAGRILLGPGSEIARDVALDHTWAMLARVAQSAQGRILATREAARVLKASHVLEAETSPFADSVCVVSGRRETPPSPFFGRHTELAFFAGALDATRREGPALVVVRGGPGSGKTRLVAELDERVVREQENARVVTVACASQPHATVRAIVRAVLADPSTRGETGEGATQARLAALGVTTEEAESIGQLLFGHGPPEARVALPGAFSSLLAAAARGGPLLLALDEADALDAPSAELVASTLAPPSDGVGAALLVALLVRGERSPVAGVVARELALGALDEDAIAAWLAHRFGATIVPQQAIDLVVERSQGNPMFVEQLVRDLAEQALATAPRGTLTLLAERADLPRSLRAILEARLDRLSTAARAVLSAIAVLGRDATLAEVGAAAELAPRDVKRAVVELDGASVIDDDVLSLEGNAMRVGVPAVLAEVARDMLPAEARAALLVRAGRSHLDAARAPEGRRAPDLVRAARFFATAGERDLALAAYDLAAGATDADEVLAEATAHALALGADRSIAWIADRLERVLGSATSDALLAPFADVADRLFARVVDEPVSDESRRAALALARILVRARAPTQAGVLLEHPLLEGAPASAVAVARLEWCDALGDVVHGIEHARAIAADEGAEPRSRLVACRVLSAALDATEAERRLREIAARAALDGDAAIASEVERVEARLALDAGDAARALSPARRALASAGARRPDVAASALLLGEALLGCGKPDRAYAALVEAFEAADGLAIEPLSTLSRAYLAHVEGLASVTDASAVAEREVAPLRARLRAFGHLVEAARVGLLVAELHRVAGAADRAREAAREAREELSALGNGALVAAADRVLAAIDG